MAQNRSKHIHYGWLKFAIRISAPINWSNQNLIYGRFAQEIWVANLVSTATIDLLANGHW